MGDTGLSGIRNTPANKAQPQFQDFFWQDEDTRREKTTEHVLAMFRAAKKHDA
jgi:hypothetical protein